MKPGEARVPGRSALVSMIVLAAVACGSGSQDAVVAEAEATIASLFDAMNGDDADAVLGHYTTGDLTQLACTRVHDRPYFEGIVRSYYRGGSERAFDYEVTAARALGPDAALVTAVGGSEDADNLFWTWALEREDGGLRIVHEHESWADCPAPRTRFHGGNAGDAEGLPDTADAAGTVR